MQFIIKNFNTLIGENVLNINFGSVLSLIGENGSGKSNILYAIDTFARGSNNIEDNLPKITNFPENREEIIKKTRDLEITAIDDLLIDEKSYVESLINEIKIILEIRDLEIKIPKRSLSLTKDFISTNKLVYKDDLNEYGKLLVIIAEKVKSKYELNDSYFKELQNVKKKILDIKKENIEKMRNSKQNNFRTKIVEIMEKLVELDKIYSSKPETILIENLSTFRSIKDSYNLNSIIDKTDSDNKILTSIFKCLGKDVFDQAIKIAESMSNSDDNSQDFQENLTKKIALAERMGKNAKKIFSQMNTYARPYFQFDNLNLKIDVRTIQEYYYNNNHSTEKNSSGYKAILNLIINLFSIIEESKNNPKRRYIILADEIDKNIHPIVQINIINFISKNIENKNIAFIISTHSPFIIDNSENSQNMIIYRDFEGKTIIDDLTKLDNKNILSAYLLFVSNYLSKNDFTKDYSRKKILLNTEEDDKLKKFIQKINLLDEESFKDISIILFKDYKKNIDDMNLDIKELIFPTTKINIKNLLEKLQENLIVKIEEEDIDNFLKNNI